jgi:hypothetical protein
VALIVFSVGLAGSAIGCAAPARLTSPTIVGSSTSRATETSITKPARQEDNPYKPVPDDSTEHARQVLLIVVGLALIVGFLLWVRSGFGI